MHLCPRTSLPRISISAHLIVLCQILAGNCDVCSLYEARLNALGVCDVTCRYTAHLERTKNYDRLEVNFCKQRRRRQQ